MMRRFACILIVLTGLCGLVNRAQASDASLCTIVQWPKDFTLKDQTFTDINGDGLKDLVLSGATRDSAYGRVLRIYFQLSQASRFTMEPDWVVPLTRDVIAYAFVDTDPTPGKEVLLLTASACFAYRLQEAESDQIVKIVDCDFLWQLPDRDHAFSWQGAVQDFDGNGKDDLFWPQAGGFRLLMQQGSGFTVTPFQPMPKAPDLTNPKTGMKVERDSDMGTRLELRFKDMGQLFGYNLSGGPLIKERHATHVPVFKDYDGDRCIDVLNQTKRQLIVWPQGCHSPSIQALPLDPNASLSLELNQQFILDLNQDGHCDFVLFTKDKQAKALTTQILIYQQASGKPLFREQGMPDQFMKIAGLPSDVQWEDINKDGYPDLSFLTFRPDLLDQVKTLASRSLQLQFLVFLNNKGRFSRTPDMLQDVIVAISEKGESQKTGRFLIDYNEDGMLDMLVRDQKTHLCIRLLRKRRNEMTILEPAAWELTIPDDARIAYETSGQNDTPVLLITGNNQIMYVRFK